MRTEDGLDTRLVNIDRPVAVIPSLCIHFDRSCNSGHTYNAQVDMQPLYGPEGCRSLSALVAEALGIPEEDMVDSELLLTTLQEPVRTGPRRGILSLPPHRRPGLRRRHPAGISGRRRRL